MSERDENEAHAQQAAAIVDSSEDAIISKDLRGIILTWNRGAERVFGYTTAEVLGRAITLLIPPDRYLEESAILAKIGRGERVERYETVRVRRDGRRIDVSLTISPIRDAAGNVIGASKIAQDITDRLRIENARARLAAIVESSEDAIISKDLRGVIQSWNPGAAKIFGYTADEAIGRSVLMLIPPDRRAEEAAILTKIARGERVERYETVRMARDGRAVDVSLTVSPLRDESGRVVGASKIAQDVTGRKRAEEAQSRLAAIVESSDDAIITKDLRGTIQTWNASAERIFGHSAAEAIGRSIAMLIPADRLDEEREILAKIESGDRVQPYETVRATKDGRAIDVSISISALRNSSGEVIGASKIVRDLTEHRRMGRELANEQERFRVTLSSIGDAVIASDVDGRVTFVNPIASKLTGWPGDEAVGRPLAEVFHIVSEETREPIDNPAQKVLRSGVILGLANHTALISRDGTERPIADSAAPIFSDDARIIGVVLTFRDVTQERAADEALNEQREWFEQTLQGLGDGVIAADVRGRVVFMNPIAEYLTGRTLGECLGLDCSDVFCIMTEKTRERAENPISRVLREGKSTGIANHTVLIDAAGTERFIEDSGAPIQNQSGRVIGAVLVFRDVSERRRVEMERSAVAQERERLLESERAARSDAERANRVKDDFVAMLSHELRTPLNAILGWTHVLRAQDPSAELVEQATGVIERNTRVQAQIVSDLIDMSRITSGKLILETRTANLAEVVEAAIETIEATARAKGLTLEADIDRAVGALAGDPARLQQVVWNLLANAVKFTPAGGRVNVVLARVGAEAHITVRDTGVGIARDFLPLLFERFRQAETAANRRFGGLGLGLAIVKQLVELHGGRVEATSAGEGKGATFRVRLPIGDVVPEPSLEVSGQTSRRREVERPLAGLRLLVVEDDQDTADLLERFLQGAGADVTVVHSAATALDVIAAAPPHVLVSDIGMPGVDGYELMRRVRKLDPAHGGGIPGVAVTAFARTEDRTRAILAGYQAHLTKPIEVPELIAAVRMLSGLTVATSPEP